MRSGYLLLSLVRSREGCTGEPAVTSAGNGNECCSTSAWMRNRAPCNRLNKTLSNSAFLIPVSVLLCFLHDMFLFSPEVPWVE